mmetsp:Transcript_13369/g.31323  ORF Transcript_13369/g.31323 Transcript_13369/m.31323 type:complete len:215 (+) Transcript_13369:1222-1866(+)
MALVRSPSNDSTSLQLSFTFSQVSISSTQPAEGLNLRKVSAPIRSCTNFSNCASTNVEPHGPPDGTASSSILHGSVLTTLYVVMSTVPPPQSRTMNLFPTFMRLLSVSHAMQAASGSRANWRLLESRLVIMPAFIAASRINPLALSFQIAGTVTTHCTSSTPIAATSWLLLISSIASFLTKPSVSVMTVRRGTLCWFKAMAEGALPRSSSRPIL